MKPLLLASLLLVPVAAHAKPAKKVATPSKSVVWSPNFDAALKEAKRTGKPVFVDFYTDWCHFCKVLDETTYRDPKFVQTSRNWVMVKVNAEKGKRNIEIAQKYRPSGFPTLIMLDSSGKKVHEIAGAYPTMAMLSEMQKAQKKMGVLSAQLPRTVKAG